MKLIKFLLTGILFGVIMTKSEAISWFRIQEMFRFESFHMYGIIGSAVVLGIAFTQAIKRFNIRSLDGSVITLNDKDQSISRYLIGGTIFGLGWALAGACPGPMFILLGHGVWSIAVVILGAILGTFLYGFSRSYLPH